MGPTGGVAEEKAFEGQGTEEAREEGQVAQEKLEAVKATPYLSFTKAPSKNRQGKEWRKRKRKHPKNKKKTRSKKER